MDADFAVELGREDPVLDFPWTDPAGELAYVDVKRHPELLAKISEAETFPELRDFLRIVNSTRSAVETAKCDAWVTTDLNAEEEVYGASKKFASYVDALFCVDESRLSLASHEQLAKKLVELLRRAPEIPAVAEICVRRCFFSNRDDVREGCYFTVYVSGYGNDEACARRNWGVGLKLVGNAILQLSVPGPTSAI